MESDIGCADWNLESDCVSFSVFECHVTFNRGSPIECHVISKIGIYIFYSKVT